MSKYTVELAGQLAVIVHKHQVHAGVLAAKEANAKPALYQDWDDTIPWCTYCGEENGHSEDCLVPHLRIMCHAHNRLLEQVEQLIDLLEREDILNNHEEDENGNDSTGDGVFRGHPGFTAPAFKLDEPE